MNEFDHENAQVTHEDLLDLNEVMQAFGVTEWKNLGPVENSHAHSLSLSVEVQGENYILRERPEGLLGEDVRHRYAFQRYLQQSGIPIPSFWLTPQGETSVLVGEDSFELQQLVQGALFDTANPRSLTWVAFAGAMLGRLHEASNYYPGPEHRWPDEAHIGAVVHGYLNMARNRAEDQPVQAISAALLHWVEQWEAVLPAAMMSLGTGHDLPTLHIHGDYHALNLRFGALGVTSVVGLEASRWEKRIFEVANGLFSFSALAWQPGNSSTPPLVKRGFDPERIRLFLHAYAETSPPTRAEAALLADALLVIAPIATVNGPLEDVFYEQEQPDEALIEDVLERLSWAASLPAWIERVRRSLSEMWE